MMINTKLKEFLWGFIGLILVGIFTYTVVVSQVDKVTERYSVELMKVNEEARLSRAAASVKVDSAAAKINLTYNQVRGLESQLKEYKILLINVQSSYNKGFLEFKNVQNEKNFIPTNVSIDEQSSFISNYQYQPYGLPVAKPDK